jgi:predicted small secreted protein
MTTALSRICRLSLLMVLMVGFTSALVGCETWKGLGKDVQDVGDSMQGDDAGKDDTVESDSDES